MDEAGGGFMLRVDSQFNGHLSKTMITSQSDMYNGAPNMSQIRHF